MSIAEEPDATLGLLHDGSPSDEQSAYRTLLERLGYDVVAVPLDWTDPDLSSYDALCWHRDRPFGGAVPLSDKFATRIDEFLAGGGGLFLSLFALDAVERLGVDAQAPDARPEGTDAESGLLCRALYSEHPVFDDAETLRMPTQPSRNGPGGTCYEQYLPRDGAVLANRLRCGQGVSEQKTLCEWRIGDGTVIGLGTDCWVADASPESYRRALESLVDGVVSHVVAGPPGTPDYPTGREDFERMRRQLAPDHHRPTYHPSPPANWLNDPNGVIEWGGKYHLFYQYNPAGPYHGTIHWGHLVSEDLVNWEDEPIALTPEPGSPDEHGCWSGCAVDDDGTPTFLYTGGSGRDQLPCVATGDDDLREWTTYEGNPVISSAPDDLDVLETEDWRAEFRDHCVWREGDTWYQIIGSGVEDAGGTALLYESSDLYDWEYRGPILTGDWPGAGLVWECPELLDLGEKSLLHVSNYADVVYFLGEYEEGSFEPDEQGKLDYGDFYAPQSLTDTDRTITWGWIEEARSGRDQWEAGWSGMLSLPREIDLDEDGDLRIRPVSELERLRREHHSASDLTISPESANPLADVRSRTCEIDVEFDPGDADEVGLSVFESADDIPERTVVRYADDEVVVERAESVRPGTDSDVASHEQVMPVPPRDDGTVELRCFLDGSVVEVFANSRKCLTSRVYPADERSQNIELFAVGGEAAVDSLDVWELEGGVTRPKQLEQQRL
ncbi:MAG: GH32 C-terminal domain-containing protein [Haloarculaceae archaeon]